VENLVNHPSHKKKHLSGNYEYDLKLEILCYNHMVLNISCFQQENQASYDKL